MIQQLINTTFPLIFIILIGYISNRSHFIESTAAEILAKIVFYIVIPVTLFFDLKKIPIQEIGQWSFIAAYLLISLFLVSITIIVSKYYFKQSNAQTIINAMASYHTNAVYLAVPIFLFLFHTILPVAIIIILQSFFVLIILSGLELTTSKKKIHLSTFPNIILRNPILIGIYLGIIFSIFAIPVPVMLNNTLLLISQSASFIALFALGLSLKIENIHIEKLEKYEISFLIFIKTIVHPLLGFIVGKYIFQLNDFWLKALILMCAMPTAKNLFIFAQQFNVGAQKASLIVFFTTLVSLVIINFVLGLIY